MSNPIKAAMPYGVAVFMFTNNIVSDIIEKIKWAFAKKRKIPNKKDFTWNERRKQCETIKHRSWY